MVQRASRDHPDLSKSVYISNIDLSGDLLVLPKLEAYPEQYNGALLIIDMEYTQTCIKVIFVSLDGIQPTFI